MSRVIPGYGLYDALKAEGYELPKNCADVELEMPVDGAMVLRCRLMLDQDDLKKIGLALVRMAEAS